MLVALVAVVSFAVLVVLPPVFLALALRVFSEDCPAPRMRPVAPARGEQRSPAPRMRPVAPARGEQRSPAPHAILS